MHNLQKFFRYVILCIKRSNTVTLQEFSRFSTPQMQMTPLYAPARQRKKPVNYVQLTGYVATGLGIGSAIAGNRKKIKLHKLLAYAAGIFTAIHIGIVEWYHHKKAK